MRGIASTLERVNASLKGFVGGFTLGNYLKVSQIVFAGLAAMVCSAFVTSGQVAGSAPHLNL